MAEDREEELLMGGDEEAEFGYDENALLGDDDEGNFPALECPPPESAVVIELDGSDEEFYEDQEQPDTTTYDDHVEDKQGGGDHAEYYEEEDDEDVRDGARDRFRSERKDVAPRRSTTNEAIPEKLELTSEENQKLDAFDCKSLQHGPSQRNQSYMPSYRPRMQSGYRGARTQHRPLLRLPTVMHQRFFYSGGRMAPNMPLRGMMQGRGGMMPGVRSQFNRSPVTMAYPMHLSMPRNAYPPIVPQAPLFLPAQPYRHPYALNVLPHSAPSLMSHHQLSIPPLMPLPARPVLPDRGTVGTRYESTVGLSPYGAPQYNVQAEIDPHRNMPPPPPAAPKTLKGKVIVNPKIFDMPRSAEPLIQSSRSQKTLEEQFGFPLPQQGDYTRGQGPERRLPYDRRDDHRDPYERRDERRESKDLYDNHRESRDAYEERRDTRNTYEERREARDPYDDRRLDRRDSYGRPEERREARRDVYEQQKDTRDNERSRYKDKDERRLYPEPSAPRDEFRSRSSREEYRPPPRAESGYREQPSAMTSYEPARAVTEHVDAHHSSSYPQPTYEVDRSRGLPQPFPQYAQEPSTRSNMSEARGTLDPNRYQQPYNQQERFQQVKQVVRYDGGPDDQVHQGLEVVHNQGISKPAPLQRVQPAILPTPQIPQSLLPMTRQRPTQQQPAATVASGKQQQPMKINTVVQGRIGFDKGPKAIRPLLQPAIESVQPQNYGPSSDVTRPSDLRKKLEDRRRRFGDEAVSPPQAKLKLPMPVKVPTVKVSTPVPTLTRKRSSNSVISSEADYVVPKRRTVVKTSATKSLASEESTGREEDVFSSEYEQLLKLQAKQREEITKQKEENRKKKQAQSVSGDGLSRLPPTLNKVPGYQKIAAQSIAQARKTLARGAAARQGQPRGCLARGALVRRNTSGPVVRLSNDNIFSQGNRLNMFNAALIHTQIAHPPQGPSEEEELFQDYEEDEPQESLVATPEYSRNGRGVQYNRGGRGRGWRRGNGGFLSAHKYVNPAATADSTDSQQNMDVSRQVQPGDSRIIQQVPSLVPHVPRNWRRGHRY